MVVVHSGIGIHQQITDSLLDILIKTLKRLKFDFYTSKNSEFYSAREMNKCLLLFDNIKCLEN